MNIPPFWEDVLHQIWERQQPIENLVKCGTDYSSCWGLGVTFKFLTHLRQHGSYKIQTPSSPMLLVWYSRWFLVRLVCSDFWVGWFNLLLLTSGWPWIMSALQASAFWKALMGPLQKPPPDAGPWIIFTCLNLSVFTKFVFKENTRLRQIASA